MSEEIKTNHNVKISDMTRFLPVMIVMTILIVGVLLIGFGYFLFNRSPEFGVITKFHEEVDSININLNSEKIDVLLSSSHQAPNIEIPPYKSRNPFLPF